mgnify:FL=1
MKKKKVPLRMCIGCQEMKPKRELLRIVKTTDDVLEYDPTSKKNGRGAYICSNSECLNKALKNHKFEKTFGLKPSDQLITELSNQVNSS